MDEKIFFKKQQQAVSTKVFSGQRAEPLWPEWSSILSSHPSPFASGSSLHCLHSLFFPLRSCCFTSKKTKQHSFNNIYICKLGKGIKHDRFSDKHVYINVSCMIILRGNFSLDFFLPAQDVNVKHLLLMWRNLKWNINCHLGLSDLISMVKAKILDAITKSN